MECTSQRSDVSKVNKLASINQVQCRSTIVDLLVDLLVVPVQAIGSYKSRCTCRSDDDDVTFIPSVI